MLRERRETYTETWTNVRARAFTHCIVSVASFQACCEKLWISGRSEPRLVGWLAFDDTLFITHCISTEVISCLWSHVI